MVYAHLVLACPMQCDLIMRCVAGQTTGQVAGIAIGTLLGLTLLVAAVIGGVFFWRKHQGGGFSGDTEPIGNTPYSNMA